uniref:Lipoprotein n=1 Tax=Rhizophora mucronata TaxID=61149 RepID=A0A2P2NB80_RHIMU
MRKIYALYFIFLCLNLACGCTDAELLVIGCVLFG